MFSRFIRWKDTSAARLKIVTLYTPNVVPHWRMHVLCVLQDSVILSVNADPKVHHCKP